MLDVPEWVRAAALDIQPATNAPAASEPVPGGLARRESRT
jgi:hypothetical protein